MPERFHSVTLDSEKCKGCTTCIKHCPTEAIRVRNGKASIIAERCIDCGQCIRYCPNRAKKAVYDNFEALEKFKHKIALPAPSLYGQFTGLDDVNYVLDGLLRIGFDEVYEVARAAEVISDLTRRLLSEPGRLPRPVISSACPAIVRLVKSRYPDLVPNVLPILAPVEYAAMDAKKKAAERTGLQPSEIGAFFISPCPAKVTDARNPVGLSKPVVDGVLSMSDVYIRLLGVMKKDRQPEPLSASGLMGIGWAGSGGEASALLNRSHIAVDGIDNVLSVLSDIEDGKLEGTEFIELNACTQGCVGGCLAVENPFVARMRIKGLMKYLPVSKNKFAGIGEDEVFWDMPLEYFPALKLDEDMREALLKMARIESLQTELPGLDCGSCGAPSCRAFAEDVVQGVAREEDCIFRLRERMQYMSGTGDADEYLPPPFRKRDKKASEAEDV